MLKLATVALLVLVGCSSVPVRRATMAGALASLACDWGQTRSAADGGWVGRTEANPVMGPTPGVHSVDLYFAGVTAAMLLAGQLLPDRIQPLLYGAVTAVQVHTIRGNLSTTRGVCGI